jgi:hypothetical protein
MFDWNVRTKMLKHISDKKKNFLDSYTYTVLQRGRERKHVTNWWKWVWHAEGKYLLSRRVGKSALINLLVELCRPDLFHRFVQNII